MSIEISITQKGLMKSPLRLSTICGDSLQYGNFDGLRLDAGVIGEAEVILFNPLHIGRGFSVVWKEGEKERVDLRLPTPAAAEEIDDFYDTVERILSVWKKTNILQDGQEIQAEDFPHIREDMKQFNLRALKDYSSQDTAFTLFCAFWPITPLPEDFKRFAEAETLDVFRDYLHAMQDIDVYYAKPMFYSNEGEIVGVYTLTEDVRSVFPLSPRVPFGLLGGDGSALEVDRWIVFLVSLTKDETLGEVSYQDFLDSLSGQQVYDADNVIIEGMPLDALEALVSSSR